MARKRGRTTRLPTVPADPDFDITKHAGGLPAREPSRTFRGGFQGSADPGRPTMLMRPQTRSVFGERLPLRVAEGTDHAEELAKAYERLTGQTVTRYHIWWSVHPAVSMLIGWMPRDELERARADLDAAVRRAPIAAFVVVWRAVVNECALRFDDDLRPIDWE